MFRELYVSIPDLIHGLSSGTELTRHRWLFLFLTEILDKWMLAHLSQPGSFTDLGCIALNLNAATVLSPEFHRFDTSIPDAARDTIVLEFQKVDVIGNFEMFRKARDLVHGRGYHVSVDGISPLGLGYVNREQLGVDLMKVCWSADLAAELVGDVAEEFRRNVENQGKERIILSRCGSNDAIEFGLRSGINLFQGRHIDHLLEMRPVDKPFLRALREGAAAE